MKNGIQLKALLIETQLIYIIFMAPIASVI